MGLLMRPAVGVLEGTNKLLNAAALTALGREGIIGKIQRRVKAPGAFAEDEAVEVHSLARAGLPDCLRHGLPGCLPMPLSPCVSCLLLLQQQQQVPTRAFHCCRSGTAAGIVEWGK